MTQPLRYTSLRHRMLAEVDADRVGYVAAYDTGKWKCFTGPAVGIQAHRTLVWLRKAGVLLLPEGEQLVDLNPAGSAQLSEWNTKHGNPLDDPGAPQARSIPDGREDVS